MLLHALFWIDSVVYVKLKMNDKTNTELRPTRVIRKVGKKPYKSLANPEQMGGTAMGTLSVSTEEKSGSHETSLTVFC